MKLKVDEHGNAVVVSGMPVYVHDDGKEIPFDGPKAFTKIKDLNNESKGWREKYEAADAKVKSIGDLDLDAARTAMETVQNLEDKKLVDAGEIDTLKKSLSESYEANLTSTKTSYQSKIDELQNNLKQQESNIDELLLLGAFERSEFIREKTHMTPDIAYASFKKGLKVEYTKDGNKPHVVGYIDGEKLFSRKDPGKLAAPEEAIEMIINAYPHKDSILKGRTAGGSGGGPGGGGDGGDDLQSQYVAAQKSGDVNKMISIKRQMSQVA